LIDLSVIEGCINNNAAAQRELYNRCSGKLFAICYRYAFNKEEAEDMLQEGFIKIFKNLQYLENKDTVEAWMKRVIVNTCINILKGNKTFNYQISIDSELENIVLNEETIASKLLGKQVMQCLVIMPVLYRTIINLHAIEGYTHKEIAQLLDIEESTCRSRYIRGKDLLENILKEKRLIQDDTERANWLKILNS
jgi:RNA polymerase sigma factor (sigma-70 family)